MLRLIRLEFNKGSMVTKTAFRATKDNCRFGTLMINVERNYEFIERSALSGFQFALCDCSLIFSSLGTGSESAA